MKRRGHRWKRHRLHGAWTFFRQWLRNPLRTAAVAPSGRELAAAMIAELPDDAQRVIELGGGTGAITRALLARGIHGRDLLVVGLSEELHAHLHARFPQVRVARGDARDLPGIAMRCGFLRDGPVDAIVSGLGFLSMNYAEQQDMLRAAFACLKPGAPFIQFTYGARAPVLEEVARDLRLNVRKGAFVLRNVPPATVFVYRAT
ncbi:class I SAM-dependent methyltransferase [Lysobacter panacisoli]|uniref:Methyltransferase domain-containing protein n=1 Tax=Lysobacter panacisoli TaxID=1255263 RepID=A0ABP9LJM3_9GAMM|nr:methyltransferase domain-containing protein [Lysobacter panacisoli]